MHVDAPSCLGLWLGGHHPTPRIGPFSTACAGRGLRRMWGHGQQLGLMEGQWEAGRCQKRVGHLLHVEGRWYSISFNKHIGRASARPRVCSHGVRGGDGHVS